MALNPRRSSLLSLPLPKPFCQLSITVMIFTLTKITTLCLLPLLVAGAPQYGAAAASTKAQAASASSTAASGAATHVIQVGEY